MCCFNISFCTSTRFSLSFPHLRGRFDAGLDALLRDLGDWTWYAGFALPSSFLLTATAKVSFRIRPSGFGGRTARLSSRGSAAAAQGTSDDVAAGADACSCETIAICAFAGVVDVMTDVLEEEAAIFTADNL